MSSCGVYTCVSTLYLYALSIYYFFCLYIARFYSCYFSCSRFWICFTLNACALDLALLIVACFLRSIAASTREYFMSTMRDFICSSVSGMYFSFRSFTICPTSWFNGLELNFYPSKSLMSFPSLPRWSQCSLHSSKVFSVYPNIFSFWYLINDRLMSPRRVSDFSSSLSIFL